MAIDYRTVMERIAKDQPGAGDVHIPSAGGSGKKRKPKIGDDTMAADLRKFVKAETVDAALGMVFGWAIVCKEGGVDYYDVQDDHIPEDAMLKASADFMENSRMAKEMHSGGEKGSYLFCWPMTTDIAKAMGITTKNTGLMIGYKPPPDVLEKFKSGEYTGFSIGGERGDDEEIS